MSKVFNIINGWKNLFLLLETDLAKERARSCTSCDEARSGTFEKFIGDQIIEIQGLKCRKCGCPLSAKLRSVNEKCPLNKW